jgi:hypothetical protein
VSNIIDYFSDWEVDAIIITIVQAPNSSGEWVDTPAPGKEISGIRYSKADASKYFNISWDEAVTDVFVTPESSINTDNKLTIGTVKYDIFSTDNIANQNEVYVIGLAVRK